MIGCKLQKCDRISTTGSSLSLGSNLILSRFVRMKSNRLLPDLFCFHDTCNVYVLRDGTKAIAIDFGSGNWLRELPPLGIRKLEDVYLTHHHADQCSGLAAKKRWPFQIHAPVGEDNFLSP